MRLRFIEQVSFCKSELTNFEEWGKKHRKQQLALGPNDVVLFVSKSEDQLLFVHGFTPVGIAPAQVLRSERIRLTRGTWNPLMLANYAERVGIVLDGIKRFESFYTKLTSES